MTPPRGTTPSALRFTSVTLLDYRRFEHLVVEFEPDVTLLVGQNAGGKTSVLDALAALLGSYVGAIDGASGVGLRSGDAHRVHLPGADTSEQRFPVSVEGDVELSGKKYRVGRSLNSSDGKTTSAKAKPLRDSAQAAQNAVRSGGSIELPLVAYYGTGRLWDQLSATDSRRPADSRLAGYVSALKPGSSFRAAAQWLEWATLAELQDRQNGGSSATVTTLLSAVQEVSDPILRFGEGQARNLRYAIALGSVAATMPPDDLELPAHALSDGVRTMLGLVLDLAWRAAVLNPHLGERCCAAVDGMVMIDEIDLHLHPSWQQTIVGALQEAFPKVQFVLTTHSPQVISSVEARSVRILDETRLVDDTAGSGQLAHATGRLSSDVLLDAQGVEPRAPTEATKRLAEYRDLVHIGEGGSEDARNLRARLDEEVGASDPELLDADRILRLARIRERG